MPRDLIEVESPVLKLLKEGRERIARGWVQKKAVNGKPGKPAFCVAAAVVYNDDLALVTKDKPEMVKVRNHAQAMLLAATRLLVEAPGVDIITFNDDRSRTHDDVIQLFDIAIELQCRIDRGLLI